MREHIPSSPRKQWNSPLADYDIISRDSCRLLFEQAKAYLDETIEESEELTQRSSRMLFLLLPAAGAIVGFIISNRERVKAPTQFDLLLILGVGICLFSCLMGLIKLFGVKNIHYRGAKPEEMMRPEIFKLKNMNQIEKALYISEIERMQVKIEQMDQWNYERILNYLNVVKTFLLMMAIGTVLLVRSI
jgi:hypothetical protein